MIELAAPVLLLIYIIAIVLALYPLLALGRIWLYSKQQVEVLKDIRDLLKRPR